MIARDSALDRIALRLEAARAEPLYGFLERDDAIADGSTVDSTALIAPRIEMELAFVTATDLYGEQCDATQALAATAYAMPALA